MDPNTVKMAGNSPKIGRNGSSTAYSDPNKVKMTGNSLKIGRNGSGSAYLDPNDYYKGVCLVPWLNGFVLQPDRRPAQLKLVKLTKKLSKISQKRLQSTENHLT